MNPIIEIARRVRVPMSDAAVRRVVAAAIALSSSAAAQQRSRAKRKGGPAALLPIRPAAAALSVAFISPREMRRLNRTYHGEDRVTDVLSFGSSAAEQQSSSRAGGNGGVRSPAALLPHRPAALPPTGPAVLLPPGPAATLDLGELVICPSYVKRQAARAGEPFRRELTRVLIHGTLHLLGEDHATPQQAERMFGMQEELVRCIAKTLNSKS